jgi:hypothetical protein
MPDVTACEIVLIVVGGIIMLFTVLKGIGQSAEVMAWDAIGERRAVEARKREEDAEAEAAGRAAALEPLALNADGSIEEPVIGMVEGSL